MHALLLALTLTSGGDLVLLDAPPELAKQLRPVLTARGLDVVTTTAVHATLESQSAKLMAGGIDEPAPGGLPPDVVAEWNEATSACRAIAGPPYTPSNTKARLCGRDLPEGLWVRFADRSHATLVVEAFTSSRSYAAVTLNLFQPDTLRERRLELPASEAARLGSHLAGMLAEVEGTDRSRALSSYTLPVAPPEAMNPAADGLRSRQPTPVAPLVIPATCKLPAKLTVTGNDEFFAQGLQSQYAAAIAGHAGQRSAAIACASKLETAPDKLMGLTGFIADMHCGKHHVQVVRGSVVTTASPSIEEALSRALVEELLSKLCGGPQRAPVEP